MEKITLTGKTGDKPLNYAQRDALLRRNTNPKDYVLVKETPSTWYFRNVRTRTIKLVRRGDRVR